MRKADNEITINLDDLIGGDLDAIREDIKERAMSALTQRVERTLFNDLLQHMLEEGKRLATVRIEGFVEEFLTKPITLTSRYGEPAKTTTAKELIMDAWQKSLHEKVNDRGEPSTYSDAKPRMQQVAESIMKPELNKLIAAMQRDIANRISDSFREEVTATILSALSKSLQE